MYVRNPLFNKYLLNDDDVAEIMGTPVNETFRVSYISCSQKADILERCVEK